MLLLIYMLIWNALDQCILFWQHCSRYFNLAQISSWLDAIQNAFFLNKNNEHDKKTYIYIYDSLLTLLLLLLFFCCFLVLFTIADNGILFICRKLLEKCTYICVNFVLKLTDSVKSTWLQFDETYFWSASMIVVNSVKINK